jgi:hypothetical protein
MRSSDPALIALLLAATIAGMVRAEETLGFFSVREHQDFAEPRRQLTALVKAHGKRRINNFCVIGYRLRAANEIAWVHWREAKAIILWEPRIDGNPGDALLRSRRYLDLERDVVETEADIKGSTYLISRQWLRGVLDDCASHGDRFEIRHPNLR